jgi:hypothetical protein
MDKVDKLLKGILEEEMSAEMRTWLMELSILIGEERALRQPAVVGRSEQLLAVSDLKDFAYEVCPLHREDDLQEIISRL